MTCIMSAARSSRSPSVAAGPTPSQCRDAPRVAAFSKSGGRSLRQTNLSGREQRLVQVLYFWPPFAGCQLDTEALDRSQGSVCGLFCFAPPRTPTTAALDIHMGMGEVIFQFVRRIALCRLCASAGLP